MLINIKDRKNQSQFNKKVKIVKNPIYHKLQKIFYSQDREIQNNIKLDNENQKENQNLHINMAMSDTKKGENQTSRHIQQHKAITLSLSTQGQSRTFFRTKQNQNLYEDYLADVKLQNHAISKAQKPYISNHAIISNEIIKIKNQNNKENKQIDFIQAFNQLRIQPLKQLKIQTKQEKSIKKQLIKQSLVINNDNINQLQQRLHYYQKMEEFYLLQINQYRSDKKLLQWKLKLIVQELLQNKKESRNYQSENGFNSSKYQCAIQKVKDCFSISKLNKSNILSDLLCQKSIYKPQQNSLQSHSQYSSNSQESQSRSTSSNQNSSQNKHKSEQSNSSNSEHFFSQYQMRTVSPSTNGQKNNQKIEISTQNVSNFQTNYLIEPINCFMGFDSKIQKEFLSYEKERSYQKLNVLINPHQKTNRFKFFQLNLDDIIMVQSDEEENQGNILKDHDLNSQWVQKAKGQNQKLSRSTFYSINCIEQNINIRKQI